MNMISTGSFLTETGASNKQSELVKKLTTAWQKKNTKAARAGGVSLMALSLAACGSEDDTPFSAADVSAAEAAATSAANAAAATAQAAAVAAAEAAKDLIIEARDATITTLTTAKEAAETALSSLQTTYDALVASNAELQSSYDALVAPTSVALTDSVDTLVGTAGNDTFTGAAANYSNDDQVVDASTSDADVYNLTLSAGATPKITNVETVTINANALGAAALDMGNVTGATVVNVTRGDVVVGGTTLTGNKVITMTEVSASAIGKIVADGSDITVDQDFVTGGGVAGVVIEATATGDITTVGAATITATGQGAGDSVDVGLLAAVATGGVLATENAKSVSVTTDAIGAAVAGQGVVVGAFTGAISVDAANVLDVDINNGTATGAVTVNAAASRQTAVDSVAAGGTITSGTTGTADATITVGGIDDSGVTITTGAGVSAASGKNITVSLTGGAASTDVATVSGDGYISLSNTNVDTLNLSGSTAAVTYNVTAGAATTYAASGDHAVSLTGNHARFTGKTITGVTDLTVTGSNGTALDLGKASVEKVVLSYDVGALLTTAASQKVELTADQTDLDMDVASTAATSDMYLVAGDEDANSSTVGTILLGDLTTDDTDGLAGTLTIEAIESNVDADSTDIGDKQHIVITGDENVDLGQVTGGSSTTVTATNSTGNITLTTTTLAPVVTTGSGDDNITVDGADVHTIMTNDGDDTITVDNTAATSTIDGGAGDDTFDLNDDDTAYVVIGGAGDDTFQINKTDGNSNMVIIGGDGSDDTLDVQGAIDTTASTNTFAISGIEVIELDDVDGTMSISAAQFANNNTVKLEGTGNDTLLVAAAATGSTIDASGVTFESTQAVDLTLQAGRLADTITGSAKNDTITAGAAAGSTGGADSYDGGAGTDTFIATNMNGVTETGSAAASTGVVINLGSTAISGTAVLAKVDDYISAALTEVASGTMTYTYAASSALNASSVSTIVNVENITGTTGADYIVGDAGANAISSNGGNDYIVAGAGADTITAGGGTDTIVIASADTGNTIDSADKVVSFTTTTDKLSLGTAGTNTNYTEVAGVDADTFADAAADANTAMNGTIKYVFINGLDVLVGTGGADGADGALFIDADLDGTYDDVIVLSGASANTFLEFGDIIA